MKKVQLFLDTDAGQQIVEKYPEFDVMRYKFSADDYCAAKQKTMACPRCYANVTMNQKLDHKMGASEGLTCLRRLCDHCAGFYAIGEFIGVCKSGHVFHMACWKQINQPR